ncbi:MAG: hypothetical protein RL150_292 [Candidatus Parcubacteria bacterium]|jgi:chromosome segregation ATPase
MAGFLDDAAAKRGIDPRALQTLALKKKKQEEREATLRKAVATRELNALRSRLSVIEREIQRLQITERRTKSTQSQGRIALEHEQRAVLDLTAKLNEAVGEHKRIMLALGKEEGFVARLKSLRSRDAGSDVARQLTQLKDRLRQLDTDAHAAETRHRQLLAELSQAERALHAIEAQRSRIMTEVTSQERTQAQTEAETRAMLKELEQHESSLRQLMSERDEHESAIRQLKASLTREEHQAKEARDVVARSETRHEGAEKSIPSLEHDREQLEQKIKALEHEIRSGS